MNIDYCLGLYLFFRKKREFGHFSINTKQKQVDSQMGQNDVQESPEPYR